MTRRASPKDLFLHDPPWVAGASCLAFRLASWTKKLQGPFGWGIATVMGLAGCASPIPASLRTAARGQPAFAELRQKTEAYRGRVVVLGGTILETRPLPQHTELEVLQKPLDPGDRPQWTEATGGRFLALYPGFLDPAVYSQGREVTVAGRVMGVETRRLGGAAYRYLVVQADSVHLWPQRSAYTGYPPWPDWDDWWYGPRWWYGRPVWWWP
jgi:outer membrane lipoprotein